MKKVVSLALSTLLVLSLAACGKADSSAAASSESKSSASSNSTSNSTQDYSPDGIKVGETYTTEDGKTYVDIYYRDYLDTYEANGKDPTSITEMVMPIVINNFNTRDIYVDETFTINPQTNSVTTSK